MEIEISMSQPKKTSKFTLKSNFDEAQDWFETYKDVSYLKDRSCDMDMYREMFGTKHLKMSWFKDISKLNSDLADRSKEKTAVIMVGLSCTGKTNTAKEFKEMYPEFQILNFDEIAAKAFIEEYDISEDEVLAEEASVFALSEAFHEKASKGENIIIDGSFVSIPMRAAILRALRQYEYKKIIAISTLEISEDEFLLRAQNRARVHAYYYEKAISKPDATIGDLYKISLELSRIDYASGTKLVEGDDSNQEWKKYYDTILESYRKTHAREIIQLLVPYQIINDLYGYGFDDWYNLY